jgi:hypothetical protein
MTHYHNTNLFTFARRSTIIDLELLNQEKKKQEEGTQ